MLLFHVLLLLNWFSPSFNFKTYAKAPRTIRSFSEASNESDLKDCNRTPLTRSNRFKSDINQICKVISTACSSWLITLSQSNKANAIGDLYEFNKQNFILQDVKFNIPNAEALNQEFDALNALCQNTLKKLRENINTKENVKRLVCGFGPDDYTKPKNFYPGISTFYEYGGHATITFQAPLKPINTGTQQSITDEITTTISSNTGKISTISVGNKRYGNYSPSEIKYIKIGTEVLRISKGMEKGMVVKYAYGWIDVDSPSGIPYEVVLGVTRDPIMMMAIEVIDIAANENFFMNILGMKKLPFPLARSPGSEFEAKQPLGSVHLGFGPDTMSLLLIPRPLTKIIQNNNNKIDIKSVPYNDISSSINTNIPLLNSITVVYNDDISILKNISSTDSLPKWYQEVLMNKTMTSKVTSIRSPEGLYVELKPYSLYQKFK